MTSKNANRNRTGKITAIGTSEWLGLFGDRTVRTGEGRFAMTNDLQQTNTSLRVTQSLGHLGHLGHSLHYTHAHTHAWKKFQTQWPMRPNVLKASYDRAAMDRGPLRTRIFSGPSKGVPARSQLSDHGSCRNEIQKRLPLPLQPRRFPNRLKINLEFQPISRARPETSYLRPRPAAREYLPFPRDVLTND